MHSSKHRDADCRAAMTAWLELCDAATFRVIPSETAAICRALVADTMQDAALAEAALPTMLKALRKMQPSKEHMTPFHAAVLQAYAPPTSIVTNQSAASSLVLGCLTFEPT